MIKIQTVGIFLCVFGDLAFTVAIHFGCVLVFADGFVIICIHIVIYQKNQVFSTGEKDE